MRTRRLAFLLVTIGLVCTPLAGLAQAPSDDAPEAAPADSEAAPDDSESAEAASDDSGSTEVSSSTVTASGVAESAGPEFSPDRPGFGDGTSVMAPWRFGFELGVSLDSSSEHVEFALPELLVRMGLTSWIEARVALPGMSMAQGSPVSATDAGVGFKVGFELFEGLGVSLVTMFDIPVADESQDTFGLFNGLNVEIELSDAVGIAVTAVTTIRQPLGDAGGELGWEAGGALALIGNLGDDASVYLEGIGMTDDAGEGGVGFGIGATRMITDSLQVDLFFEYGVPDSGTTVLIGGGLSFML